MMDSELLERLQPLIVALTQKRHTWAELSGLSGLAPPELAGALIDLGIFGDSTVDAVLDQLHPQPFPPLQLLDADRLKGQPGSIAIDALWSVGSTNRIVQQRLQNATVASGPVAVTCEYQTAGRGRMQRVWVAPLARNVMLSLGAHLPASAASLAGLSLAVGVEVCRALADVGCIERAGRALGLKWPNDLLLQDDKIGGILVEVHPDEHGTVGVIIGVGINLYLPQRFQQSLDRPAAHLHAPSVRDLDRNALIVALVRRFEQLLTAWPDSGFAPWMDAFEQLHLWQGRQARVLATADTSASNAANTPNAPNALVSGQIQGVNEAGELGLLTPDGQCVWIRSGELSLRLS
ncbi:MAG: biotin--[acetyl-CoA-carboxylase] ligase [Gammaproteobacteria bacterium]